MSIEEIKKNIESSSWSSLATEIRPSIVKTPEGDVKPLFCSRKFVFPGDDMFELTFVNYADPNGKVPLVEMQIRGHIRFGAPHPVAPGAYELDYFADESMHITVLHEGLVSALNQAPPAEGLQLWEAGKSQDVKGRSVPAFGLKAGVDFNEYDLIYLEGDMLFNGSRHVDGRPFDSPANRPTNLQIPLKKN